MNKILHTGIEGSFSDNYDKVIDLEKKHNQLLYEAKVNGFELGEMIFGENVTDLIVELSLHLSKICKRWAQKNVLPVFIFKNYNCIITLFFESLLKSIFKRIVII
jgi:hypothetical protein